jgi:hypothetical protein
MGPGDINSGMVSTTRRRAIVLQPKWVEESVSIRLRGDLGVDELPAAVSSVTRYGRYSLSSSANGLLTGRRSLVVYGRTVPTTQHATLKLFLQTIRDADLAAIVLTKSK